MRQDVIVTRFEFIYLFIYLFLCLKMLKYSVSSRANKIQHIIDIIYDTKLIDNVFDEADTLDVNFTVSTRARCSPPMLNLLFKLL